MAVVDDVDGELANEPSKTAYKLSFIGGLGFGPGGLKEAPERLAAIQGVAVASLPPFCAIRRVWSIETYDLTQNSSPQSPSPS